MGPVDRKILKSFLFLSVKKTVPCFSLIVMLKVEGISLWILLVVFSIENMIESFSDYSVEF